MERLPHWVLTNKFPALFDSESATVIEQTARVYGAMQSLIDDYNLFVDKVNEHIQAFEDAATKNYDLFTKGIRQEFQDFIDTVTLKIQSQDRVILEAVEYMGENLEASIEAILAKYEAEGSMDAAVKKVFNELVNEINVLSSRMNTFTALEDGSTTGDAELLDIRVGADGTVYASAGKAVREQIKRLNSDVFGAETHIDLNAYTPSHGIFNESGIYQTNGSYVITKDIVNVCGFKIITVEPQAGYAYNIAFYESNDESSFVSSAYSTWIEGKHSFVIRHGFIRIQMRNINGVAEPEDLTTKISLVGTGTIGYNEILKEKTNAAGNEAVHFDIYTQFTQGALINGELSNNASYVSTNDFIDVRNYRNIRIKNGEGYKSAVVAYDENKVFLWGTAAFTDENFCVDVSSAAFVKVTVGRNGGLFDGEGINVSVYFMPENHNLHQFEVSHQFITSALVNGAIANASTRISTKPFINISDHDILNVTINENYYYSLVLYSDKTDEAMETQYTWSNVNRSFDVSGYKYFRISLRRADNANIAVAEGANIAIHGIKSTFYNYAKRPYEGNRISLKPTLNYYNVLDFLSSIHESAYPFTEYYQQGAGIHNGYLFMMRHHGACTVLELSTMKVVSEFLIDDITGDNPHCNSGSFSRVYPSGNADFPYLYTGRCSYSGDTPDDSINDRNACYVLNMTLAGATLAQTIVYENDNVDYTYGAWDWFVDADRNRLVSIGYTKSSALSVRPWIIKEFALPEVEGNAVVTLHDSDVIEQWQIEDNVGGHSLQAFQGCTAHGDYYILPASEPECLAIFNKYTHRLEAYFDLLESEVDEVQCAAVYNGVLYLVSEGGRIDKVVFD